MTLVDDNNRYPIESGHPLAKNVDRILIDRNSIQKRIAELGKQISEDYANQELVVIGVLKGALPFMAELIKHITVPMVIDFVATSTYVGGLQSTGVVRFQKDVEEVLNGRNVLVVEDIVDSGITLRYLTDMMHLRNPKSLEICCLIDKPVRRKADIYPKYIGFTIPDRFIIGFGLDYEESYRNLDFIGILSPSAIAP
ncbi:hypoxanthine phosphoribosyltransferase [bacterium]|nr:hypoxanthine phosphoribosyltransferase [bacterium]